jgi:hypothetical protein
LRKFSGNWEFGAGEVIEEKEFKVVNDIGLSIQTGIEQIERFFNSLSGVLINKPLIDSIKRFEALNCLLTKEQKEASRKA